MSQSCGTRVTHDPVPPHAHPKTCANTLGMHTHDPANIAAIPKKAANPSRDHPDTPQSPGCRRGSAPKRRQVINQPNLGLNYFRFYYLFSKAKSQKAGSFRSTEKVRMMGQKGAIPPPNLPKKLWDGVPQWRTNINGWQQHPVSCSRY